MFPISNTYMAMNFFQVLNERLRPILFNTYKTRPSV